MFSKLAAGFADHPGVELADSQKKGFGAGALKINGKIFAMVTKTGHFVVKLSRQRVADLASEGKGSAFDPGHGRLMKEWLQVHEPRLALCRALAQEALEFVASTT
jgi:hypothetical protein